jgi:hypothetical protein
MANGGSSHDFDFWMGSWKVRNRRLRERLVGSTKWDEFEATAVARPLLGGIGNEDVFRTDFAGGFTGMSFRFFDTAARRWSIYWADSRKGKLEPPVVGGFDGDVGCFEGTDTFERRPIRVRFLWSRVTTPAPRWEQAFSEDGGRTWETNWVMDMERDGGITTREFRSSSSLATRRSRASARASPASSTPISPRRSSTWASSSSARASSGERTLFTYLRGFPSMDARAEVKGDFYNGLLWKEHASKVNDRLVSSDDVLLLRPLAPGRGLPVLPAVDVGAESRGAAGAVVLQIFEVKEGSVEALAREAEDAFAGYRGAGAREAAVLATLDAPNNFPRHPVRTDGPHVVWVGLLSDEAALERLMPLAEHAGRTLSRHLRSRPELVFLDPTPRSRLRGSASVGEHGRPAPSVLHMVG